MGLIFFRYLLDTIDATLNADVIPQELLGPSALLVASLIVVGVLWREDRRVYRERILDLTTSRDLNAAGWKAQTDANVKLAEAWEARNLADGERRRRGDGA